MWTVGPPRPVDRIRFAVRRDWPDGGHDYFRLSPTPRRAQDAIAPDRRYWRRGPVQPTAYRVVAISPNDFELHRGRNGCRSPDCP
jgi:hypothetical protein